MVSGHQTAMSEFWLTVPNFLWLSILFVTLTGLSFLVFQMGMRKSLLLEEPGH